MAVPVLKLNLVPPPTLWRQQHEAIGWVGLGLGILSLAGTLSFYGLQTWKAQKAAKESVALTQKARLAAQKEATLIRDLADFDVSREMPRWRLAERIYQERALPWSRVTAELERSLVDGVRVKSLSRSRATDGSVEIKLRGESKARESEAGFIENLQKDGLFSQVVLEREAERQGGGQDFEVRLPLVATPSSYQPLPIPEPKLLYDIIPAGMMVNPLAPPPPVKVEKGTKKAQGAGPIKPSPKPQGPAKDPGKAPAKGPGKTPAPVKGK